MNHLIKSLTSFTLLLVICLLGCSSKSQTPTFTPFEGTPEMTASMVQNVRITDFHFDRAFYFPQEPVTLIITLASQNDQDILAKATASILHLSETISTIEEKITISRGEQNIRLHYTPPASTPRGYGIDLCLITEDEVILDCFSTSFDVLDHWTQHPRYGFLSDFFPERTNYAETIDFLARYHINGVQFYDWMYRHEQFLTEQEPYTDLLGRRLSRATVERLIAGAHEKNIVAMPYTAIYAASTGFYKEHPEWALYQYNGQPYRLGENFLVYMDPRPGSPWVNHLLAQFNIVLQELDFDGIHLDQYGDPHEAYDFQGNKFALSAPLAETINATKAVVLQHRAGGSVVFNAVANWPIETVAKTNQDFIYVEVWPPYTWFQDLYSLISRDQELGDGKPVVLAAYVDPAWENNVRLVDAVIFASGGGHIELGESGGMLSDPYFPKYKIMSSELSETIRRYYDFAIRYQEVIGPRALDVTSKYFNRIKVNGSIPSPSLLTDIVWPIVRKNGPFTAINLINLSGIKSPEWARKIISAPTNLRQVEIRIIGVDHKISHVWLASPDSSTLSLQSIEFTQYYGDGGGLLLLTVPYLEYWDLIIFD